MIYVDSGILLKLYLTEPDSNTWRDRLDGRADIVSSALSLLEFKSGLRQKMQNGLIRRKAAMQYWQDFRESVETGILRLVPLGTDVIEEATKLLDELPAKILLRSLDACHLASACFYQCDEVATSDARMRAAANELGISLM